MFGWLRKLTGGARTIAPPPVSDQEVALPAADVYDTAERASASLIFQKPATIDPFACMFGAVRLAHKDEAWPSEDGVALTPLLQINLTQAPVVPAALGDLALITIFVADAGSLMPTPIVDSRNPDPDATWVLRSYPSLEALTIPRPPRSRSPIAPLLGEWGDPQMEMRPDNEKAERVETGATHQHAPLRLELGGWPITAGGVPWWAADDLEDTWDFVLLAENGATAGWQGAAYIARSRERPYLWAIDVQVI